MLTCPYNFFHLNEQKSDQISIADGTTGSHVVYNNGLVNVRLILRVQRKYNLVIGKLGN